MRAATRSPLSARNGAGKSTIFKLIAGETQLDLGDLVMEPGLRYGYLPQVPNVPPDTPVHDVLSAPSPEAQRIAAELADLEAWMARPDAWDAPDAAAKMADFMAVKERPRNRVLRVVKDWETGTAYHGGDVIALTGAEIQAFLRLLRWAEANDRVERL
jgi:ATPase subunit of ABC transporter with duplicated ATPase domains